MIIHMTNTPSPAPTDDHNDSHLMRGALVAAGGLCVLVVAWLLNPEAGGILTLISSVLLAVLLPAARVETDGHTFARDAHGAP